MKSISLISLLSCTLAFSAFAEAPPAERTLVQRCLDQIKKESKESPETLAVLDKVKLVPDSVSVERYDRDVGRQHIATQVTATLRSPNQPSVMLLCLLENDKPLYTFMR